MEIKAPVIEEKSVENEDKSLLVPDEEVSKITFIKKKREFRKLRKIVKEYGITSTVVLSHVIGVKRDTIAEWLNTPQMRPILAEKLGTYIKDIEQAKDWKAKAYLLDKFNSEANSKGNLVQVNNIVNGERNGFTL